MRIHIELADFRRSIELDNWHPQLSITQLIEAAGGPTLPSSTPLYIDGKPLTGSTNLASVVLLEGSSISQTITRPPQPGRGWTLTLAGGSTIGTVLRIPQERPLTVGGLMHSDIVLPGDATPAQCCRVERTDTGIKITDCESATGVYVNGIKVPKEGIETKELAVIRTGKAVLIAQPQPTEEPAPKPGELPNITPAGTAPFNRPPRPGMLPPVSPIKIPKRKQVSKPSKFSYATVLSPLIFAGAMVGIMRDIRFAFFALLSPIAAIAMWAEQKWRYKRDNKEEEERFAQELTTLRQELQATYGYERVRLQEMAPDPVTVMRRVQLPTTGLWQRRFSSSDYLSLHVGYGNYTWIPPLDSSDSAYDREKEVNKILNASQLSGAPVIADVSDAGVIGIVGDRAGALALARSLLVQAVTHCGPADMTVGVFCDQGKEEQWSWTSWLPHTRQAGSSNGGRWISNDYEHSLAMLKTMHQGISGMLSPGLLLLIDSEVLTEGRDAPARELLGYGRKGEGGGAFSFSALGGDKDNHRVSGIVIAASKRQLPSSCTVVINVGEDSAATFTEPEKRRTIEDVITGGVSLAGAAATARSLAQFDDPELVIPGAGLPSLVRLPELTGVGEPSAQKIIGTWQTARGFSTEIGVGDQGTFSLDLVKDGPHGLVGGTTGSGKSEFLRSLVAGLATHNDPTRLNFILIDFKGGAAFKACERLPHTIGTISNLDEQLANRALISLEAEMERRQRLFAATGEGVDNITEYLATNPAEPMPRLLLVIDEFAMLAKEFPDVLSSLVSIGAVGRTLGVHMILATQRPAGVVNNDILANTNLRVALRVQSKEDSSNVIDVPDAASIERSQMGRAYIKLGQGDITPVQTALVTGFSGTVEQAPIQLRSVNIFGVPEAPRALPKPKKTDANDLDDLIDAIVAANTKQSIPRPRKVWPKALGNSVPLAGFTGENKHEIDDETPSIGAVEGNKVLVALADIPEEQRQIPHGWDIERSNLLLLGAPGSGTSTALTSLALTLCLHSNPEAFDMLILDMGAGTLEPLKNLPHVSSYVGPGEGAKEKQTRFLRYLMNELNNRRSNPVGNRKLIILIDGFGALKDEFSEFFGTDYMAAFYRVYTDGPALGMHIAMTSSRVKGIPSAVDDVSLQRWLFHLADVYDYATYKIKGTDVPAPVPGRCVDSATIRQMHVATSGSDTMEAVQEVIEHWGKGDKSDVIGQLPSVVPLSKLKAQPVITEDYWSIPVGIAENDLKPVSMELYEGENALIAGSPRSGKSTLLQAIADSFLRLRKSNPQAPQVWVICGRRSPLAHREFDRKAVTEDEMASMLSALGFNDNPVLLLVDDAERITDRQKGIENLLLAEKAHVRVVVTGNATELVASYGHWTKLVRKSRTGVLLKPNIDYDGALFSLTSIPRRSPVDMSTGRGYAVLGGPIALVQTISPDGLEV